MFNLSDKELDRLSREAADAYEVENNTSSWSALEQRLDKELGTLPKPSVPAPAKFTYPFAYTSVIILLVGASYFLLKSGKNSTGAVKTNYSHTSKKQNADKPLIQTSAESNAEKNSLGNAPSLNETTLSATEKKPAIIASSAKKPNALFSAKEKGVAAYSNKHNPSLIKDESKKEDEVPDNAEKKDFYGRQSLLASKNGKVHNKSSLSHPSQKYLKPTADDSTSENQQSKSVVSKERAGKSVKRYGARNSINNNDLLNHDKIFDSNKPVAISSEEILRYAASSQARQAIKHFQVLISDSSLRRESAGNKIEDIIHLRKKNSRSLNIDRSLQVGVSFAPEFSRVKHTNFANRLGTGFGITLGYQLMNRLSINSGLIYSHKYYQANDQSFHLASNLSSPGLRIEYVNGSLKMFEIPLNLRYDISTQGNSIFFVNAGISSYIMQKQNYLYYCHGYNGFGPGGWYKQDYNAQQNFWFSMINLSAGFETGLSKSMSLQVDPYIKIPVKGVGIGNVQLCSYGINFAIKFSPILKKSRN
ncbi:MAG TPA: hypothetical protein VNV85_17040 [Puia sp.]|nr:hypothetical protein [Puia sp.]